MIGPLIRILKNVGYWFASAIRGSPFSTRPFWVNWQRYFNFSSSIGNDSPLIILQSEERTEILKKLDISMGLLTQWSSMYWTSFCPSSSMISSREFLPNPKFFKIWSDVLLVSIQVFPLENPIPGRPPSMKPLAIPVMIEEWFGYKIRYLFSFNFLMADLNLNQDVKVCSFSALMEHFLERIASLTHWYIKQNKMSNKYKYSLPY